MALIEWRASLSSDLGSMDEDQPLQDILSAYLRAKYWELRYVINRLFLDFVLNVAPHLNGQSSVRQVALRTQRDLQGVELSVLEAISRMGQAEVLDACARCIAAALQGGVAFGRIPEQLPVTDTHSNASM